MSILWSLMSCQSSKTYISGPLAWMINNYMLFKANPHLLQATLKPESSVEAGGPTTTPNPRTHTLCKVFSDENVSNNPTGTHPPCYSCCKSGHCKFLHCVGRIVKRNWSGIPNKNLILDSHKISVKLQRKKPCSTILLVNWPSCFPLGKVYLKWLWNRKKRNRKLSPVIFWQNSKMAEIWNSFLCSSALTCAGRKTWAWLKTMMGKYPKKQRTNTTSTIIGWNLKY